MLYNKTYRLSSPPFGIPAMIRTLVIKAIIQLGIIKIISHNTMSFRI
jgi:hypothetical protein